MLIDFLNTCTGVKLSSLESSKPTRRQGTLKELFKQHTSGTSAVVESADHMDSDDEHVSINLLNDKATCPVCNQSVPAENTAFNQHIDECLNSSAIQETLSEESVPTFNQCSNVDSPRKSPPKRSSCESAQLRKRKAPSPKTTPSKRRTLDHYFRNNKS